MNDLISRAKLFDELNCQGVPYNAEVNRVINGMPSEQQWTLCDDEPPEKQDSYFVTWESEDWKGKRFIGIGEYYPYDNGGEWDYPEIAKRYNNVRIIAWMELPEAYDGD